MREYQRTTRACTPTELRPELLRALEEHALKYELGEIVADSLGCVETASEKIKKGLFDRFLGGGSTTQYTGVIFTGKYLVWATTDGKVGVVPAHARLAEIEVSDYNSPLIEDSGLDVFGFVNRSSERVQAFIGLGDEAPAAEWRQKVRTAVSAAHSG